MLCAVAILLTQDFQSPVAYQVLHYTGTMMNADDAIVYAFCLEVWWSISRCRVVLHTGHFDEITWAEYYLKWCMGVATTLPGATVSHAIGMPMERVYSVLGSDMGFTCGACHAFTKRNDNNVCSNCRLTHYCNHSCQKSHWKKGGHKESCAAIRKVFFTFYLRCIFSRRGMINPKFH